MEQGRRGTSFFISDAVLASLLTVVGEVKPITGVAAKTTPPGSECLRKFLLEFRGDGFIMVILILKCDENACNQLFGNFVSSISAAYLPHPFA
jgi:hypothetical protein